MPDDNRTQGPSNDAPRDPLDDLIAPILGRDVTPEPRDVLTLSETSKHSRRNPLDDLVADAELRAEASKAATRFAAKDQARWHFLRSTPGRVFAILALVLVAIGALIGEQVGGRRVWNEQFFSGGKRQVDTRLELPNTEERSMALVPAEILTPKELFASASPAIVRVNVYNERSKPIGHGSGFFVRNDSTLITNFHVIDGANSAEVVLKDGTQLPVRGVEAADEASDIAILKVDRGTKNVVRYLTLGSNELPPVGGRVYVIGSPKGYDYTLSDGIVSGHHERDGRKWIQSTAPISHGSSGSPVLSDDGTVLGVATWVDWGGQNLNFASPTRAIASLLGGNSKFQSLPDLIAGKKQLLASMRESWGNENIDKPARVQALDGLPKSFHQLPEFWLLKAETSSGRDETILSYRNALALDDRNSQIWWLLGNISAHSFSIIKHTNQWENRAVDWKSDYDKAIEAYRKGIEADSQDERNWLGWGEVLLENNCPSEAIVPIRRSLEIEPDYDAAHRRLGVALAELGDVEGGIAEYKTGLEIQERKGFTFALSYLVYGNFLVGHGRQKEAIAAFEKALTLKESSKSEHEDCKRRIETCRQFLRSATRAVGK